MPPAAKKQRWFHRVNLLTSMLLVFPVFLVYQVGVLAVPEVHNGADLITREMLTLLRGDLSTYILVNLGLALVFVITILVMRNKNEFELRQFVPVVLESSLYAVCMGGLILFVMQNLLHIPPSLSTSGPPQVGFLGKIILSFGAGVHEELVFRLILVSAFAVVGERLFGLRRGLALAFAFLISSFLFSAAHHVVGGEPWRVGVFVYRFLCGLVFATLFQVRGFAVAVYTHAIYDVFVLTLHG
jgi:membrane protease YdiL (CAAX protease family)